MRKSRENALITIIRLLVQLALFALVLFWLFYETDLANMVDFISAFSPLTLIAALTLMGSRFFVLAARWKVSSRNRKLSWPWFFRAEWQILFLEHALPFPDAEDLFRVAFLRKNGVPVHSALKTVFWMRVAGLSVLCVILVIAFAKWGHMFFGADVTVVYSIAAISCFLILTILRPTLYRISYLLRLIPRFGNAISSNLRSALENNIGKLCLAKLLMLSFLHFCIQAAVPFVLLVGLGAYLPFLDILLITPFMALSFLLPLSIQGLGLPETTMVFLLPFMGVPEAAASAVGAVHLACYLLMIFFGGMLVFTSESLSVRGLMKSFRQPLQAESEE